MTFTSSAMLFLLCSGFGAYVVIALFSRSALGLKLSVPAMALEIVLGFGLGKAGLAYEVTHGPTYLLGEIGVIAIIAAGGVHVGSSAAPRLLRQAATIAVLGVSFSIIFIGVALFIIGIQPIPALVLGLALAPTSAGVGSRVLVQLGKNKTVEGNTFFVTAIIDDTLGLIGLALVEIFLIKGNSNASVGVVVEAVVVLISGILYIGLRKWMKPFRNPERWGLLLWVVIASLTLLANNAGSSPVVISFALVVAFSPILQSTHQINRRVEDLGIWLIPMFFVSLGAIAASFGAPPLNALPISLVMLVFAVLAKFLAVRLGYGRAGFVALAVMLTPRAEITFVIALAAESAKILNGSDLFAIAVIAIVLGTMASVALPRLLRT